MQSCDYLSSRGLVYCDCSRKSRCIRKRAAAAQAPTICPCSHRLALVREEEGGVDSLSAQCRDLIESREEEEGEIIEARNCYPSQTLAGKSYYTSD